MSGVAESIVWGLAVLCALFTTCRPFFLHHDDAFFYYELAERIAAGEGSRFHRFALTNGYHPLWLLVCAGLARLGFGHETLPFAASALANLLSLTSMALVSGALRRHGIQVLAPGLAMFAAFAFWTTLGLEGQLLSALLGLGLYVWSRFGVTHRALEPSAGAGSAASSSALGRGSLAPFLALHCVLALAVLARLDALCLVAPLAFASWISWPAGLAPWRRLLLAACPYMFLIGGYLLVNQLAFDHPLPINARIKAHVGGRGLLDIGIFGGAVAVVSGAVAAWAARDPFLRRATLALAAGVALHALVLRFGAPGGGQLWYYFGWFLALAFNVPVAVAALCGQGALLGGYGVAAGRALQLGSIAILPVWVMTHLPRSDWRGLAVIPEQLDRSRLPAGTPIFVYDLPGALGFLGRLEAVPADGLMSDAVYDREVVAEGLQEYLRRRGIRYFMGRGPLVTSGQPKDPCTVPALYSGSTLFHCRALAPGRFEVVGATIYTPLSGREAGRLELSTDRVVDTFDFGGRGYAIWQLDPR